MASRSEKVAQILCNTVLSHIKAMLPPELTYTHMVLDLYRIFSNTFIRALSRSDRNKMAFQQNKKSKMDPKQGKIFVLSDRAELRCIYPNESKEGYLILVR